MSEVHCLYRILNAQNFMCSIYVDFALFKCWDWTDRSVDYHGNRHVFDRSEPACVPPGYCETDARPKGHAHPNCCMYHIDLQHLNTCKLRKVSAGTETEIL